MTKIITETRTVPCWWSLPGNSDEFPNGLNTIMYDWMFAAVDLARPNIFIRLDIEQRFDVRSTGVMPVHLNIKPYLLAVNGVDLTDPMYLGVPIPIATPIGSVVVARPLGINRALRSLALAKANVSLR